MGKVEQIEQAVQTLSSEELVEFRAWFQEFAAEAWDRQIEADARAGKLDALAETALRTHRIERLTTARFDELSIDEQIDYVQSLWDRIAARPEDITVPEWHEQVLEERLASLTNAPDEGIPWEEVSAQLRKKLSDLGR